MAQLFVGINMFVKFPIIQLLQCALLTLSIRSVEWLLVVGGGGAGQNRFQFISAEREMAWPVAKTH